MDRTTPESVGDLATLIPSWTLHLRAVNLAPRTIDNYLLAANQLVAYMSTAGMPAAADAIRRGHVEAFIVDQIRRIGADPQLQDETFRAAVGQVKAQQRGLRAERRRLERTLVTAQANVERLVGVISRVEGSAADAIATELAKAQSHVQTVEARLSEIDDELATLKTQDVDRDDLAQALEEFDGIWSVLLVPERERVLRLLVETIDYDGGVGTMSIQWRLSGFGQLAAEVGP